MPQFMLMRVDLHGEDKQWHGSDWLVWVGLHTRYAGGYKWRPLDETLGTNSPAYF